MPHRRERLVRLTCTYVHSITSAESDSTRTRARADLEQTEPAKEGRTVLAHLALGLELRDGQLHRHDVPPQPAQLRLRHAARRPAPWLRRAVVGLRRELASPWLLALLSVLSDFAIIWQT